MQCLLMRSASSMHSLGSFEKSNISHARPLEVKTELYLESAFFGNERQDRKAAE